MAHAAGREGDRRLGNDRGDRREGDRAGGVHGGAAGGPAWRRAWERDRVSARLGAHVSQGHGSARQQQARRVEHHGVGTLDDSERCPSTPCRVRRTSARGEKGQEGRESCRRGRSWKQWRGRSRTGDWKERLIEELLATSPDRFERLARRLLREAGFISATVTGKSGDGGIDGIGVYRLSLVSFPVFFQCKRYKGSVGAGAVRDFRGAMSGRGDKGLVDHNRKLHRRREARSDPRWSPPRGTGAVASRASLTAEGPPPWRPPRHDRRMKHVYGRTTLPLALITPCTASGVAFCWHLPLMIG